MRTTADTLIQEEKKWKENSNHLSIAILKFSWAHVVRAHYLIKIQFYSLVVVS